MGAIEGRFFTSAMCLQSAYLLDFITSIADQAIARLECEPGHLIFTSEPSRGIEPEGGIPSCREARGTLEVTESDLGASALSAFLDHPDLGAKGAGCRNWRGFRCRFSDGQVDLLVLRNVDNPREAEIYLTSVWPALRRAILNAQYSSGPDLSDDALLWVIDQKVNAAILVIDAHCRVLKTNAAADEFLEGGRLLQLGPQGLVCASRKETEALRAAVRESYQSDSDTKREFVLLLRGKSGTAHMPMSLSTYVQAETGARLILLMLPRPPDHERIEGLARQMGLTPSEARVAALIREGHSNKKAAEIAGLKVETFNTYAKRALSKMNVKCRAEMAQMLTWQAALERP